MKKCIECGEEKQTGEFPKGRNQCKPCRAAYQREWRRRGGQRASVEEHRERGWKDCPRCEERKPLDEFNKSGRSGWQTYCRECNREYQRERNEENREEINRRAREHYRENREEYRDRALRSKYGITSEDYQRMHDEQGGVCAICRREETAAHANGKVRRLAVDHDHETGEVRGLLCFACNVRVGYFENGGWMKALHDYLEVQPEKLREVA